MSDLPTDLVGEILSRLPAESLLRFRCVCKDWGQIIDDAAFIKRHLRLKSGGNQLIIGSRNGRSLYKLSLGSLDHCEGPSKLIEAKHLVTPIVPGYNAFVFPRVWCDGLLLISDNDDIDVPWALWNPCTREYHKLPLPDEITRSHCIGLGYDSTNDDYKVVRISHQVCDGSKKLKTLIYSLKSDSWTTIKDSITCWIPSPTHGIFFNDELYCLVHLEERGEKMKAIIALDLVTETYRQVPFPSELSSLGKKWYWRLRINLYIFDGCLILSAWKRKGCLDGWEMNCRGGKDSWAKLFSFSRLVKSLYLTKILLEDRLTPMAYLKKEDKFLIRRGRDECIWLDVENKSEKRVKVDGLSEYFHDYVFPASLVRLNKSGRVDEIVYPAEKKSLKFTLSAPGPRGD